MGSATQRQVQVKVQLPTLLLRLQVPRQTPFQLLSLLLLLMMMMIPPVVWLHLTPLRVTTTTLKMTRLSDLNEQCLRAGKIDCVP